MTKRKDEPTLEVSVTLTELMAVVKSLSIGVDQLAKKIQRLGDGKRADSIHEELTALLSAKQEMEDVLTAALGGTPW
jgi:uncharacterized coiled-coil DUF342 family protein